MQVPELPCLQGLAFHEDSQMTATTTLAHLSRIFRAGDNRNRSLCGRHLSSSGGTG